VVYAAAEFDRLGPLHCPSVPTGRRSRLMADTLARTSSRRMRDSNQAVFFTPSVRKRISGCKASLVMWSLGCECFAF
jgi:hypothetical protein